ncbi:MAG: DUF47 domain-containing protein [Promethearchaeota archaeon]
MKKKEKGLTRPKLQGLFEEDAELMSEALMSMASAVSDWCSGKNPERNIKETIQTEKKQDRLKENILERLFKKETMVFSRSDRLKIANGLDSIVDKAETIVRRLEIFTPEPQKEILDGVNWMAEQIAQIGTNVKELIIAVFKDFSKGKPLTVKITDIRREVRNKEYEMLKKLFEIKPDYAEFLYFEDMVTNLTKVANNAEEFADDVYGLICKYTLD